MVETRPARKMKHRHSWSVSVIGPELRLTCACGMQKVHTYAPFQVQDYRRGIVATDGSSVVWFGPKEQVVDITPFGEQNPPA